MLAYYTYTLKEITEIYSHTLWQKFRENDVITYKITK